MRLVSKVKSMLVPAGVKPRTIVGGVFRGLTVELDFQHKSQIYLGLWERETHPLIRRAAARCQWAIDVGAGQGELCLYLLKHSPARAVHAIEPQQSELDGFRRNLAHNGLAECPVLHVHCALCGPDGQGVVALDSLEVPAGPGFLKVDVDGAEMTVLRSGERLLGGDAPRDVLVETHAAELERDCQAFLDARGYTTRIVPQAWWRAIVPEHRPIPHNRYLWATRG